MNVIKLRFQGTQFLGGSLLHVLQTLWDDAWPETGRRNNGMGTSARPLGGTETGRRGQGNTRPT